MTAIPSSLKYVWPSALLLAAILLLLKATVLPGIPWALILCAALAPLVLGVAVGVVLLGLLALLILYKILSGSVR